MPSEPGRSHHRTRLRPLTGRPCPQFGTLSRLALKLAGIAIVPWQLIPGMALSGLGMGLITPTLTDFVLAGVPERHAWAASGVINTIFQVGSAAGVAGIGVVFFGALSSQPAGIGTRQAYVSATEIGLYFEAAVYLLTFLLGPLLARRPHAHAIS